MGYHLDTIHEAPDPFEALSEAEAIFVGGGNTFRLLDTLYRLDLLRSLESKVRNDTPYVGVSAGANIACPTIKTTNDMPIIYPPQPIALRLIPFQINPHYIDPDPDSKHRGETREMRIHEFHEENDAPVLGLREGSVLRLEGQELLLTGLSSARLFRKGREPKEISPGAWLNFLLEPLTEKPSKQ
jgi:dipeptidase E